MDNAARQVENPRVAAESTPLPARASDDERERLARDLARESVDGRISTDTFSRRLERAFAARTRAELDDLVDDLPPRSRTVRLLADAAYRAGSALTAIERAWVAARAPRLTLPGGGCDRLVVGRGSRCDCTLPEDTVSRRHALLLRRPGGWTIEDLGSLNGTRLNGWPVAIPTQVRSGDVLSFGGASYRVTTG